MISQFTAAPDRAPLAGDLRRWLTRWFDRLRDSGRRRREAQTLAGLPDEILRDIGVVRRDFTPPRRPMLPLDRR